MDLEVVGRHALLFDDDAMAAFVNSSDALVEWHSLQIDRYDVRHLLSAPPPPRRRNRNSGPVLSDDPSLESLLDQERYLDLPLDSDQPEVKEDEKTSVTGSYHSVAFFYGNTDDSAHQKNTDAGMESSGYLPPFPIPGNLLQSLPPTEKVHQIIARTAIFVSKHGGQSEIILRVKQGDNPTFGFLMPDNHLHAYFRYLVEHQELLHSEFDGKSQYEGKNAGSKHNNSSGVGGALSLLGSVYGSGEEEDGDDTAKTQKDFTKDNTNAVNATISHDSKNGESMENASKDESASKNPILSNKEKVLAVKKNSLIVASKPKSVKGIKKVDSSGLFSVPAEKSKNYDIGVTSKIEPLVIEPPPELKRLIDKLVEFILRNGKQFEATIIEQDSKHVRFPFLLPSNQYHPYYLKVLQTAQESKVNGKSFYSGKDDLVGYGINKKASVLKENDFSSFASAFGDMPLESDKKEKFKMVIGKSKKEAQETEFQGTQESGVMVDAAAAAAILQAATKGIKNSDLQTISSTSPNAHSHANRSEGGQPASLRSIPPSQPDNAAEKSDQNGSCNAIPRTASLEAVGEADYSDANLTEEQKLKAERLKRAKMFVAMLKSGAVPFKTGTSRASSVEPLEPGVLRSATGQEREGSLAPAVVDGPAATGYLGERQSERLLKRKYRSRSGGCDDDDEDGHRNKEHSQSSSRRKDRSISRRHEEDDEIENAVEKEHKHRRRRRCSHSSSEEYEIGRESSEGDMDRKHHKSIHWSYHSRHEDDVHQYTYKDEKDHKRSRKKRRSHHSSWSHSSSEENENGGESSEEDSDHKRYKLTHRSHHSQHEDDGHEGIYKEEKDHKRSCKKRRSHHSSRESSRRRCSSKQRKKHRSHRSSHHSRDKHRHRNVHSSRDRESRRLLKPDSSSDDELQHHSSSDQHKKDFFDDRDELEEGEISSAVSEESRGITSGQVKTEIGSSPQRAPSQPSETTGEVPDDLRAKIRAMLMATQL
ncbi:hypothetical protein Pfo_022928 [Paulownia fortunei]|nr:hypothetical protein Pfo_022928 [Paulownia fortunei]